MSIAGAPVAAVLAAAVATYATGFVIYGLVFDATWMELAGYSPDSFKGLEWRMALSPLPPLMMAVGMAFLIARTGARGAVAGAALGALVWLAVALPARLYGFVYGVEQAGLLAMDAGHLLANLAVAGAIVAGWPRKV